MMSTEKKTSKADYRRKKLTVFDHQIHQKLATELSGVSFDAHRSTCNDMQFSGVGMKNP